MPIAGGREGGVGFLNKTLKKNRLPKGQMYGFLHDRNNYNVKMSYLDVLPSLNY